MGAFKRIKDLSKYVTNSGGVDHPFSICGHWLAHIDQLGPCVQGLQRIVDDVGVGFKLQGLKLLKRPIKDIFDILRGSIGQTPSSRSSVFR